ncbi:GNAT family N-acetyltransferase [Flavobacterium sp. 3HN19-14]|uniref:GNAT family N-acetyltransferase n=1 Tax=Flavobacterium sp. 3HN19-14 TaxID=3448133 RepID=UPI003EE3B479
MIFREATIDDIRQIQIVRNSVTENPLSNPDLVTDKDCEIFMFERGRGWVCEIDKTIVGFAIADLVDSNIWALFLHPDFEKKGIGRKLHDMMLDWYFSKQDYVWLGTAPGTRAEIFYEKSGWRKAGMYGKETKFEMTSTEWQSVKYHKSNL